MPTRRALRVLAVVTAGAAGGCETGSEGADAAASDFCARVGPAVEAFLERARAEHPVPTDERYGGTLVIGGIGELASGMNAFVSADYASTQHQQFVNLMTLLDYDENLQPRPYLAESWDVSEDGSSVTFHLRRDVFWHDGEPTDAHDVAFTYRRSTDPQTGFPNAGIWDHWIRGPEGVDVIDDYTVRIHLEPHSEFLDAWRSVGIMPQHLLADVAPQDLRQHPFGTQCPVGNGPFVFRSHLPQQQWTFEANPAFPEALGGRPYVDRYVYRVLSEQTTLLTDLLTENVDVYLAPPADQAQAILDDPNVDLAHFTHRAYVFVGWNARRPQLADARVRRAITMGTNREEVVAALLRGYGTVANSGVPPFHWAFDPEAAPDIAYDPDGARALLDDAGWTDRDGDGVRENERGEPLAISIKYNTGNQQRQDVAEIMQAQLATIGVDVRPQVVEWATLLQQITDTEVRDFDGVVFSWIPEFRLEEIDFFHSDRIDQPYAFSGTRSPELDTLLERLTTTVDRDEARPLWREYQEALAREVPYTYLFFPDRLAGVNRRLRNVEMDARGDWQNIRSWWIDPERR